MKENVLHPTRGDDGRPMTTPPKEKYVKSNVVVVFFLLVTRIGVNVRQNYVVQHDPNVVEGFY